MKRIFHILIALLVLAFVLALVPCISHGHPDTTDTDHSVSVLTYNTHRMGMYRKPDYNQVIHYIRRTNADIVCLQEVEVYKSERYLTLQDLRDALRQYKYTYYDFSVYNSKRQYGNVVFSKYPLTNKQTVRYKSRANISSRCDVVVGGDTIRLIVNHLESNRFTKNDFSLPDSITSEAIKESARHISEKLESAREVRHAQAEAVHDEIIASPHPVIVAGDFNSTPLSYAYWRIRFSMFPWKVLKDAFLESGWLHYGATFVKRHLGLRIDYILCSRDLHVQSFRVDEVNYSDHYPILSTIGW